MLCTICTALACRTNLECPLHIEEASGPKIKPDIGCCVILAESLQGSVGISCKTEAFRLANIVEPPVTKSEFSRDSCELRVYFLCANLNIYINLKHRLLRKEVKYLATLLKG